MQSTHLDIAGLASLELLLALCGGLDSDINDAWPGVGGNCNEPEPLALEGPLLKGTEDGAEHGLTIVRKNAH
jgi:hypothetical protein